MKTLSICIPVMGEKSVERTVDSIINSGVDGIEYEILVLRNGIKETMQLPDDSQGRKNIRTISIPEAGKGKALNRGTEAAKGEIIMVIDADCKVERNAVKWLLSAFDDEKIMAASGKIEAMSEKESLIEKIQMIEYVKAFDMSRYIFNKMNADFLISGAFGAFAKSELKEIGGYDEKTVGEDIELVLRLQKKFYHCGKKIAYVRDAICYTGVPKKMGRLLRQRDRWQRGLLYSLIKYRSMLFNPKYRNLGLISLPLQLIFELLGPFFIISGLLGIMKNIIPFAVITGIWGADLLSTAFLLKRNKIKIRKIGNSFFAAALFTIISIPIQILLSFRRIFAMLTYKKRKMVW